jgi:hypothetical protein
MPVPPGGNTPHQDAVGVCDEIRAKHNLNAGRDELIKEGSANHDAEVARFRSLRARQAGKIHAVAV